jgi:hypothetical protein
MQTVCDSVDMLYPLFTYTFHRRNRQNQTAIFTAGERFGFGKGFLSSISLAHKEMDNPGKTEGKTHS